MIQGPGFRRSGLPWDKWKSSAIITHGCDMAQFVF